MCPRAPAYNAGQTQLCRLQTRAYARTTPGKRQAIFYGTWDVSLSLMVAFFVNAAILITAAGQIACMAAFCIILWRRALPRWQEQLSHTFAQSTVWK